MEMIVRGQRIQVDDYDPTRGDEQSLEICPEEGAKFDIRDLN